MRVWIPYSHIFLEGSELLKGLEILKESSLDTVQNEFTTLSLLGRGDGLELMKQTVNKDRMVVLFPGEENRVVEFFYILAGQFEGEIEGSKTIVGPDNVIIAKDLKAPVHFKALTDVTFLSFSNVPSFHYLSNEIMELRKIGELVEQKDRYTFNHSARVAELAVKTAMKMRFDKTHLSDLFIASILHDIGKINILGEVLTKPAKLTDEEFALIKKHPSDGAEMLRKTAYADLADIVEQHHERVNGRGYPFGLKEDEILLEAKIIGVCDTFDAMTEDRAYRKAFSADFAMAELRKLAGVQYDPAVVEAFYQVLKEEGKIE